MSEKLTTETWIRLCKIKHDNKYDYCKSVYIDAKSKVCIICPIHGEFWQDAYSHKKGVECPTCAYERVLIRAKLKTIEFSKVFESRARAIHGDFYDYSKVSYKTARIKVCIVCPKHGDFWQPPHQHLTGTGCPDCGINKTKLSLLSDTKDFVAKANSKHDNAYLYTKTEYVKWDSKVIITCDKHGDFTLTPNEHLNGRGCPECVIENRQEIISKRGKLSLEEKGNRIHKNRYRYDKVKYVDYDTLVEIICPIHGSFWQSPDKHLSGCGCQKCSIHISKRENDLVEFLKPHFETITRDRKILHGKELDIYIPEKKIAIEYNGSLFHSEKYNKNAKWHLRSKQDSCWLLGIRLIHVSDYEDQEVIKKTLCRLLGINVVKLAARKCSAIVSDLTVEIEEFLTTHHLQGSVKNCVYVSLTQDGSIKAVGCFSKVTSERGVIRNNCYELRRYCSDGIVVGGLSKVIKNFVRSERRCKSIVTYSDNKWFNGDSYAKVGFKLISCLPPDYKYVSVDINKSVKLKGSMRRSRLEKLPTIIFDPLKTEVENCRDNGWYRVWDCGKKKWILEV